MKTKDEIQREICELLGVTSALSDAMEHMHEKRMDATKRLFALHNMLRDIGDSHEPEEKNT